MTRPGSPGNGPFAPLVDPALRSLGQRQEHPHVIATQIARFRRSLATLNAYNAALDRADDSGVDPARLAALLRDEATAASAALAAVAHYHEQRARDALRARITGR